MAQDYLPTGIADPSVMIYTIAVIMMLMFIFGLIAFIYYWITD